MFHPSNDDKAIKVAVKKQGKKLSRQQMDPQEMDVQQMDLELGLLPGEEAPKKERPVKEAPFLVHLAYEFLVLATYSLIIGRQYGTFTTGLPPKYKYEYVSAAVYDFFGRFRMCNHILWKSTKVCKGVTLKRTAQFLHQYLFCFFVVFFLFVYLLVDIIRFHQDKETQSPVTILYKNSSIH